MSVSVAHQSEQPGPDRLTFPLVTDYQTLTVGQTGAIVRVELDRPEAANGMNDVMTRELAAVAHRCAVPEVKAVVLTGTGRFFCAGGDLKAVATSPMGPGPFVKSIADDLHQAMSIFARMDAVLITAVNGVAAGAGFSLGISGDLVLAAESASFTMAYTRAGLSPDGGATFYLPRIVGVRRAHELMLTNRTLTATEAAEWGLVNEVVPDDQLSDAAEALAQRMAAASRASSAAVKKLLLMSFGSELEEQLDRESELIGRCADGADGVEGVDAFLNKRAPEFS